MTVHPMTPPEESTFGVMHDRLDAVIDSFEWTYPDRSQLRGEVTLDRERNLLVLEVWTHDNENPDDAEVHPLEVTRPVRPFTDPREQVRQLIHGYLCHEADEQMWFDGERTFYPHDDEATT